MPTQYIRTLPVFLASPGDVGEERHITRQVVEAVNDVVRSSLGWEVLLLGWEDVLAGSGRPQDLINPFVDACDLFVGLVYGRMGSPTGKYYSGFVEEFERALARRKQTKSPEVWLFFKQDEKTRTSDPGFDLQRVRAFRAEHVSRREVLFKEFEDGMWEAMFHKEIMKYLLKLAVTQSPSFSVGTALEANLNTTALISPAAKGPSEPTLPLPASHSQLRVLTMSLTGTLANSSDAWPISLNRFEAARLYLFASALMNEWRDNDILGVREINAMYLHKEEFQVTAAEEMLLLRTLIADQNDTVPGCYWLRNLSRDELVRKLSYAAEDANRTVRLGAIQILENLKINPSVAFSGRGEALLSILRGEDYTLGRAVFKYLTSASTGADLPLLDMLTNEAGSGPFRNEAMLARSAVHAKVNPEWGFAELLANPQINASEFLYFLHPDAEGIGVPLLLSAAKHSDGAVREYAVRALWLRGELPSDLARSMLADPFETVRDMVYQSLIERGEMFDPRSMLKNLPKQRSLRQELDPASLTREASSTSAVMTLLSKFTLEELNKLIDWHEPIGPHAYKARGLYHFQEVAGEIRADLEDGFARINRQSDASLRLNYGAGAEEIINKAEGVTRAEFTVAALAALGVNGEPQDIEYGRRFLADTDPDIAYEAIRLVGRFGDLNDTDAIVEAARRNSHTSAGPCAAEAALKLSADTKGTASALLATEIPSLAQASVKSLLPENKVSVGGLLTPLLYSRNKEVRLKALAYFVKRFSEDELASLMDEYTKRAHYFYDVLCHLDRILYAPQPIKDWCRRVIESEL